MMGATRRALLSSDNSYFPDVLFNIRVLMLHTWKIYRLILKLMTPNQYEEEQGKWASFTLNFTKFVQLSVL